MKCSRQGPAAHSGKRRAGAQIWLCGSRSLCMWLCLCHLRARAGTSTQNRSGFSAVLMQMESGWSHQESRWERGDEALWKALWERHI